MSPSGLRPCLSIASTVICIPPSPWACLECCHFLSADSRPSESAPEQLVPRKVDNDFKSSFAFLITTQIANAPFVVCDCGGEDKRFQIAGEQLTAAEAAGGAQAALFLGRRACFRWPLSLGRSGAGTAGLNKWFDVIILAL